MSSSSPFSPRITRQRIDLLRRLTEVVGVSGGEGSVRRIIRDEIESSVDDLWIDPVGNLLAIRHGRGRGRLKVMLAAHMDEVGFMITEIGADGFLGFQPVGVVDRNQLLGKSVWIGDARQLGVIGTKPIHLTSPAERSRRPAIESLRIDLGTTSRETTPIAVEPGDRASFATAFRREAGSLFAKALDDRLGVATLIELVRGAPDGVDLMAAFTVQEEIGQAGARVAAQALEPDVALALDVTPARDLPTYNGTEHHAYNTRLGKGPAIYAADRATVSDPRLLKLFTQTAERSRLPYQIRQPGGGRTDAAAIHLANAGIPSISVSVPARHLHGPVAIARIADWQATLSLIYEVLATLRPSVMRRRT